MPHSIEVAVCVCHSATWLDHALRALGPQAPRVLIVVGGADRLLASSVAAIVAEAAPHARLVTAGEPAMSAVRNAALAACEADVVALVEDDVVVAPGWMDALERAWARAPDDVALIGGPIRPRLEGGRPGWLRDSMLSTFGLADFEAPRDELDLARETLHGGNLSVRCDALRGVGGFWPARGHRWGRDWFSDEHHAQHELASCGWHGRFEPAAAAERMIGPNELRPRVLLARRFRYGARMGMIGGRRRPAEASTELRRALTAIALSPLRARSERLLGEHADCLAVSLGVLAAPLVAKRDFQPTGTTEFRRSVPLARRARGRAGPRRARRRQHASGAGLILLYHSISDDGADRGLAVSPEHFAEQLEVVRSLSPPIAIDELLAGLDSGRLPPRAIAVTFDDGYADNLHAALPRLEAAGIPATLYAATGPIASQTRFVWDELAELIGDGERPESLVVSVSGRTRAWRTATPEQRSAARTQLQRVMQPLPREQIADLIAQLRDWAGRSADGDAPEVRRPMTVDELRTFANADGASLGAHTRWHLSLAFQPPEVQLSEIRAAREDLAGWLDTPVEGFSYPYGIAGSDVSALTRGLVKQAGYSHAVAVTNVVAPVSRRSDRYALPRVAVPDLGAAEFERWLSAQGAA